MQPTCAVRYPALKGIESLIAALTCGWIYLIGNIFFGRSVRRLAGFLSTVYPFLVYYTGAALAENLFTFLLAAGIVFLAALTQQFRWRYAFGGGLRFWSLYPNRSALEKTLSLLSYGILFPFMLIGAVWSLWRNWCGSVLLWGVIALFVGSTLICYGSTRMRLPIEPYLITFAAFALDRLGINVNVLATKIARGRQ